MDGQGHVIGIDLGTTNSVVAVIIGGEPEVIPNAEGQSKTPSVIALLDDGQIIVGEIARRQAATQPQRTISSAKRLIGRFYNEVVEEGEQYPFELDEAEDGRLVIPVGDRAFLPEELSALVLEKLKLAAEHYLGESVERAIVTVPAYFDDMQRQATLEAARLAGLEVLRLINEPTAAAMAYGLGREDQAIVAIYDFGGGTFDFSVLDIENKTFEVLVSTGNSRLGGDDLDDLLVDLLAERFLAEHQIDLRDDLLTLRRLKDAAEAAKCELSTAVETLVSLPFISYRDGQPLHLEIAVTRDEFEDLIEPLVRETIDCCRKGLRDAGLKSESIQRVILVGGSTRIPLVQESVEEFFGLTPFKGVNPDEVVAIGAATQGAVLNGELDEVVLLDVTPHNLGIEIRGNRVSTVIEKNSTIPLKVEKTFTTTEPEQTFVNIHVLQGEGEKASDCRSLGRFTLSGIEPAAPGVPRIRVTFLVNADGIIEITASDSQSGAERSLKINHAYLNGEERRSREKQSVRRQRRRRSQRVGAPAAAGSTGAEPVEAASTGGARSLAGARRKAAMAAAHAQSQAQSEHGEFAEVTTGGSSSWREGRQHTKPALEPAPAAEIAAAPAPQPAAAAPGGKPAAQTTPAAARKSERQEVVAAARPSTPAREAQPADATPLAVRHSARAAELAETCVRGEQAPDGTGAAGGAPMPGSNTERGCLPHINTPVPPELSQTVDLLTRNSEDELARKTYEGARDLLVHWVSEHAEDASLQLLLARYHLIMNRAEDARQILQQVHATAPDLREPVRVLYGALCRRFPNYLAARHDRARLALDADDLLTAMGELEFLLAREEQNPEIADLLGGVYERIIECNPDPHVQFKLVKLHLRRQKLDAAIGLLQQLVHNREYRQRASRVLGLCFWQKGMRYLAWQKLRELPVDEEMKDILYRLSADMELNDELLHARYALERIYEADIQYRDVAERMEKLAYRVKLQEDERYGGPKGGGEKEEGAPQPFHAGGEFVRRFELLEELNRGSMGIVFRARDKMLEEVVAIKVLNDFLCADPEAIERFKQEARAARKLTHQNIVRIHDMFEMDGHKIISMEYIDGEDLKALLKRNMTFSEDITLNFLMQICEGLAYAHRLNIVHRDVKPANIMITDRNQVKITDFGIAKILTANQTIAGTTVMGTPLYMAPEQIEGGQIDHRCDIYALGIMLYELVTGRPPFCEGNIEYQHLNSPAPEIKAGISDRLKGIIMKCIEKSPEKRFQTVEEILARII
ncbi:MAG TPA: molecular chaperone DnaK [Candidatus Sumerlaeota bacterium]|nr:molecular chaperone DnaK [Candidatus Sumerlaeota bacterium]